MVPQISKHQTHQQTKKLFLTDLKLIKKKSKTLLGTLMLLLTKYAIIIEVSQYCCEPLFLLQIMWYVEVSLCTN
jgi:hypothetical protein